MSLRKEMLEPVQQFQTQKPLPRELQEIAAANCPAKSYTITITRPRPLLVPDSGINPTKPPSPGKIRDPFGRTPNRSV